MYYVDTNLFLRCVLEMAENTTYDTVSLPPQGKKSFCTYIHVYK